jgi:biopolymer transport protein ExbD
MAIRHGNRERKVAEVNMSSMTDIIFMLLIFFMLTSTLVKFFGFQIPESDSRTNTPVKLTVNLEKSGKVTVGDRNIASIKDLEKELRNALSASHDAGTMPTITIAAEKGVAFGEVTKVMSVCNSLKVVTKIATQPKD